MRKKSENWTIRDVAREAGVSIKTVSHVMNGKSGVKTETRAQVMRVIKSMGYHPHMGARAMRGSGPGSIGVAPTAPPDLVPISQGFYVWLYEELYRVFGRRGYYITFDLNPFANGPNVDYGRGVWEQAFRAVLLAGPLGTGDKTVVRIHEMGIPYMALGRLSSFPECSSATVDYEEAAYLSAKHLLARGHTQIGMLQGFHGFQPGVERRLGYARAMEEAGVTPGDGNVRAVDFNTAHIASMTHRILDNRDVTALIDCSGSENAQAVREGARRAGRVPGSDFDVITWTYTNNAASMPEACAHIWLPVREAAADGLEQLIAWIDRERDEPIAILYRPTLFEAMPDVELAGQRRLFAGPMGTNGGFHIDAAAAFRTSHAG